MSKILRKKCGCSLEWRYRINKVIYHTIIVVKMVSTKKTANTIPKNVSAVLIHI